MLLSDSAVKIISPICVALLSYLLKYIRKPQIFNDFSQLSNTDKFQIFSLLQKHSSRFLDEYATQSHMLSYGVRCSPQFMKNLFYYTYKNKIRIDNKDLSAFLSLPGFFICSENGEVRLQKGIRFISFLIFSISLLMMLFTASLLPGWMTNLQLYLSQKEYILLVIQAITVIISIFGVIMSLIIFYITLSRSVPAFRFARRYRAAWRQRDLFEVGEQNLCCGNKVKK